MELKEAKSGTSEISGCQNKMTNLEKRKKNCRAYVCSC